MVSSVHEPTQMAHLHSIKPGTTVFAKGFNDEEFEVIALDRKCRKQFPHFICRLRCTFLTEDQLWRIPAIHLSKRPFKQLKGFAAIIALIAGMSTGVSAEQNHILHYCKEVAVVNAAGISASPNSRLGEITRRRAGYSKDVHEMVWEIARSSIHPICRGIW